ncbi:phage tail protein I [Deefgea piscis]|uniref:phage tail protein I n=1 Tax=Deefgea piscis TaxID=2739061 RepID=UPI001C7F7A97|nr:phage tail protein I [Deefgea piscis]QZA80228.1 phage tail protein I [Deefgea piscis]
MADFPDLVPPLASDPRFNALAQMQQSRLSLDLTRLFLIRSQTVKSDVLPWLADQFSLISDGWELAESDTAQRELIVGAIALHKRKGTPSAIRDIVRRLGFGEVDIIESISRCLHDGKRKRNGMMVRGNVVDWASYRVLMLDRVLTIDQADRLEKLLRNFAPARCHLASIEYRAVPVRRNGVARYDRTYKHGSN